MSGTIRCEHFTGGLTHLNGTVSSGPTRMRIARSMVTLSCGHLRARSAPWVHGAAIAFLQTFQLLRGDCSPSYAFLGALRSRRADHAYELGEAFTHWFGQRHMGLTVVKPLEDVRSQVRMYPSVAPWPKAFNAPLREPLGSRSEPDFLGFSGTRSHVLESKGLSEAPGCRVHRGRIKHASTKGLLQACRVETVNGVSPASRVACVFTFDHDGSGGLIVDPPAEERYDLEVDLLALVRSYFDFVVSDVDGRVLRAGGSAFEVTEFLPGAFIGIDREVASRVRGIRTVDDAESLLRFLAGFADGPAREGDESTDIGPDGILLSARPDTYPLGAET